MRGAPDSTFPSSNETATRSLLSRAETSIRSGNREAQHYVGFANYPNQVHRRAVKNGFEFTLMVVGQSGLGKSTFVNTLFLAEINDPKQIDVPKAGSTVTIEQKRVKLEEGGTTVRLTLVDTPGFGDHVDNNKCWEPIIQFVESRYLDYFAEETKIERKERVPDRCVHLCLYFVAPTGHGLKALDIEFMRKLHEHVNIIPVIAKADCLTKDELAAFKVQILKDIETAGIKVYKFPEPEDEDERKELEAFRKRIPFAVVGSNTLKDDDGGRRMRYREYVWGVVEVDNLEHNDFIALRDMVIRRNLVDLIDVTRNVHYENFRFRQMGKGTPGTVSKAIGAADRDPFTSMEAERKRREADVASKQKEMMRMLDDKVQTKNAAISGREARLNTREAELRRLIDEKRAEIDKMCQENDGVHHLAPGHARVSRTNSKLSLERISPTGTAEKGKSRFGLFNRN